MELNSELKKDIQRLKIKTLCTSNRNGGACVIFPAAGPLNDIAIEFHTMTADYGSSTFICTWKMILQKQIANTLDFSLSDVCRNVWTPSLKWCCQLIEMCKNRSVKLSTIDMWLKPLESKGILDTDLVKLSKGSSICMNSNFGIDWIKGTCANMRAYWMLCTCREPAALILS